MEGTSIYSYKIVETRDLLLRHTSYGILAERMEDGVTKDAALIPDISCDSAFVLQLVKRCERNQLDPSHMLDVVMAARLSWE